MSKISDWFKLRGLTLASGKVLLGNSSNVAAESDPFALTTTGSSGASTYSGGTLNVPQYSGGGGGGGSPTGRLTLTSGTPLTTSDVTGATSVYYTPYTGNTIQLWDGSAWTTYTYTELTLALGTVTSAIGYDVFAYQSSGTVTLEKLAWTSATARATAVTLQDGRYCKSGDKTRLLLGSFYTTSTTTTEDSAGGTTTQVGGKRFLSNVYNTDYRDGTVIDTTDFYSYATATWRVMNGATAPANCCEVFLTLPTRIVATFTQTINPQINANGIIGIGIDNTTPIGIRPLASQPSSTTAGNIPNFPATALYRGYQAAGYHSVRAMEKVAQGTVWFLGDDGGDGTQSGMIVEFRG